MKMRRESDIQRDVYLNECAKKLLRIKVGNNRLYNNLNRVKQDVSYERKKESDDINFGPSRYIDELKKREFSLSGKEGGIKTKKKINNIELMSVRDKTTEKNKMDKPKTLEK